MCSVIDHKRELRDSHGRGQKVWRCNAAYLIVRNVVSDCLANEETRLVLGPD